ncbi:hypothetical protein BLNAU_16557 [Blattamonas nauphoetae]|uniref:Uncharacterized protein n=1 Tax=Blattamonas nauphoetae TaxID=2049346 RepID=A0ABQ9X866_9EUKA|nr:hypothetical protein BLNAU_16557 [Blattamonas nauphoetae]
MISNDSTIHQVEDKTVKRTTYLEMILNQICSDCTDIHPMMLQDLLVLVSESDWALSTILDVEYINPLEEYCEKTQPCDIAIALPKMLFIIGTTMF